MFRSPRTASLAIVLAIFMSAAVAQADSTPLKLGQYTVRAMASLAEGVPLRDAHGVTLGPRLDEVDFCDLAAAGAGVIGAATYRVVTSGPDSHAFCGRYYSRLHRKQPVAAGALGRSRFERVTVGGRDWPHGVGALDWLLVPGRTAIARSGAANLGDALLVRALIGARLPDGTAPSCAVLVADIRDDADTPIALYLGVAGRAWQPPASELVGEPLTDRERVARLRATLRYHH
jgi:hypothetical protein